MIRGNDGIIHKGSGDITVTGIVGSHGTYNKYPASRGDTSDRVKGQKPAKADVGVITILSEESSAVKEVLQRGSNYQKLVRPGGRRFYEATVGADHDAVRVVVTQALGPGQSSAILAFEQLCEYCAPPVVVLCGIAGGIDASVGLGDVVVAREIVYYDLRKETDDEIHRRGQSQPIPAIMQHAVNDMFTEFGEPMILNLSNSEGTLAPFKVLSGPVGTGEAVIACDRDRSGIRDFLKRYNYKTLAVETETGGVAAAFYEQVIGDSSVRGWLAVRGISDHADETKDDAYHRIASRNAATVLERLLPYLKSAR